MEISFTTWLSSSFSYACCPINQIKSNTCHTSYPVLSGWQCLARSPLDVVVCLTETLPPPWSMAVLPSLSTVGPVEGRDKLGLGSVWPGLL